MRIIFNVLLLALLVAPSYASRENSWLDAESQVAIGHILQNISPADASPGAVVAAPSRTEPNYYYHWVRDAALVMDTVVLRYENSKSSRDRSVYAQKLHEYLDFSEGLQNVRAIGGLGEPKFEVDGSSFDGPWGRPQNDGPALRALSFIHWARVLLDEQQTSFVKKRLYDGRSPSQSVIKRDLEYVSHHWQDSSFDLWEEVQGDHFYTRMVQRRALLEGSDLAIQLGDFGASEWYASQAREIEGQLKNFWDNKHKYFRATMNRRAGVDYKSSELDVAVILGMLHGFTGDEFLKFSDPRVLSTIDALENSFRRIYPINQRAEIPGVAFGRYPEDRYGGSDFDYGNPWPLCTLAIAEAYFRAAQELGGSAGLALVAKGDALVNRVKFHANADGSLSEQMDRYNGFMKSAPNLTWNYAAVLTAANERAKAMQMLSARKRRK
jgi:glucoamylase